MLESRFAAARGPAAVGIGSLAWMLGALGADVFVVSIVSIVWFIRALTRHGDDPMAMSRSLWSAARSGRAMVIIWVIGMDVLYLTPRMT